MVGPAVAGAVLPCGASERRITSVAKILSLATGVDPTVVPLAAIRTYQSSALLPVASDRYRAVGISRTLLMSTRAKRFDHRRGATLSAASFEEMTG